MPDRWLRNHRVTSLWSGTDQNAVAWTRVPQFSLFKQLADQQGSRIFVHYYGNSAAQAGDVYVDAVDLGPVGSPTSVSEPDVAATNQSGEERGTSVSPSGFRAVNNALGVEITAAVVGAAGAAGIPATALFALLEAESALNPKSERWGRRTVEAQEAIDRADHHALQQIITDAWPDISFGYSQRIVEFHDVGDHTASVDNCLHVRQQVFADSIGDISAAARRLAGEFQNPSCDGSPLSAMLCYNAGSDRRSDPAWLKQFGGNVENYKRALAWADTLRT